MSATPEPVPQTIPEPETAFDDLDVDAPRVGIVMGSKSWRGAAHRSTVCSMRA